MGKPGFYEFFCGGGMARAGLGEDWAARAPARSGASGL